MKARAKLRAQELNVRARRERKKLDPNFEKGVTVIPTSNVGVLLQKAAKNLGIHDCDVSIFEARLQKDWLFRVDQLKGKSADFLSRYMPYGLAEEVQRFVDSEYS